MSDYTPVPEADLEASFMETLALLRQNSTDGHAAMSGLQRLTEQLTSEAYRRGLEHKNVMAMLDAVNETLKVGHETQKESNIIIKNSRPKKKTVFELLIEGSITTILVSAAIVSIVIAILCSSKVLIYFNLI